MQRILFTSKKLYNSKNMVQWLPATWRKKKTWYDGLLQLGGSQKHDTMASCNLAEAKNMVRWFPATWRKLKTWYDAFLQLGGS
jgi:hypothetical protein